MMARKKSDKAEKIAAKLDIVAHHLADRIIEGQADVIVEEEAEGASNGDLPIQQEISAFTALFKYYEMLLKREGPINKERPFNGYQDEIADLGRGRSPGRASNGKASTEPDF